MLRIGVDRMIDEKTRYCGQCELYAREVEKIKEDLDNTYKNYDEAWNKCIVLADENSKLKVELEKVSNQYKHLSNGCKKAVDYTFELNDEIERLEKELAVYMAALEKAEGRWVKLNEWADDMYRGKLGEVGKIYKRVLDKIDELEEE